MLFIQAHKSSLIRYQLVGDGAKIVNRMQYLMSETRYKFVHVEGEKVKNTL